MPDELHGDDPDELQIDDPAVLAALYDPLRYRLFRLLETPRSVAELGDEVGMPANRLYYHVRRLVECGLVRRVDVRARGRHTVRIYGRAAARIRFAGDADIYGGGLLRGIADELDTGLRLAGDDAESALLSYHVVSLTPRRARELAERLRRLIAEYEQMRQPSRGGNRFGVLGVLAPLPGQEQR